MARWCRQASRSYSRSCATHAQVPFRVTQPENGATVQFNHRLLATGAALLASATLTAGLLGGAAGRLRTALFALGLAVLGQYVLGVVTLLWVVPVALGTAHQAMAVLVLTAALAAMRAGRSPAAAPVVSARMFAPYQ